MNRSRSRARDRVRLVLAGAAALGLFVGVSAAAYTDEAHVQIEPIGGFYDLAFDTSDAGIVQGDPTAYAIDATGLEPIKVVGDAHPQRITLLVRNNGTTAAGTVTLTMSSLLPTPTADADGVVRDPFTVLVVSVWVDGALVADDVPASTLAAGIPDWGAGQTRTVVIQPSYPHDLGTPFYYGKDVRLGLRVTGTS